MYTHIIVRKEKEGIFFLDKNKSPKTKIDKDCIMDWTKASRIVGCGSEWIIVSLAEIILNQSLQVKEFLQNTDIQKLD